MGKGKLKDYYEKYCSKCEHEYVAVEDKPCIECIKWLFEECQKNPTYTGWRKFPNFKRRITNEPANDEYRITEATDEEGGE